MALPSVVGSKSLGNDAAASGTTVAVTRAGVSAGNALCCWVSWASAAGTTCTVSDNVNGAWTQIGAPALDTGAAQYLALFYFVNTGAGSTTVTATVNASTTKKTIALLELTGVTAAVSPLGAMSAGASGNCNITITSGQARTPCLIIEMAQHASGTLSLHVGSYTSLGAGDAESGVSLIADIGLLNSGGSSNVTVAVDSASGSWHAGALSFVGSPYTTERIVNVAAHANPNRSYSVGRVVNAACSGAVARSNAIAKTIALACSGAVAVNVGRVLTRVISVTCSAAVTRSREVGRVVTAACGAVAVVARSAARTLLIAVSVLASPQTLKSFVRVFTLHVTGAIAITFGGIASYARNVVKAARRIRTIYALAALRVVVGSAPVRLVRALMRRRKVP